MFMNSAVLTATRRIDYVRSEMPAPEADELLVRVLATGVCGSDLAAFRGVHPYKGAPAVLGHEMCGVVERPAGRFNAGDLVCTAAYSHCDTCGPCRRGHTNLCQHKENLSHRGWEGSFAEFIRLKPNMVYRLPADVVPVVGALVEPLSIGLHAVRQLLGGAARAAGTSLRVIGAGNIGLACLISARALGFGRVVCSDLGLEKGRRAIALGADAYVDVLDGETPPGTDETFDAVVVASSHLGAIDEGVDAVRPGGTVVVVSFFDGPQEFAANTVVRREIAITGSSLSTAEDFRTIIDWLGAEVIDPLPMVSHLVGLNQTADALRLMDGADMSTGKIILIP